MKYERIIIAFTLFVLYSSEDEKKWSDKMKINYKKLSLVLVLGLILVTMTGCVQMDANGNPTGWVYEYFGVPATHFLNWLAGIFGGNYGIAIIIVRTIVGLFMLPSSYRMTKNTIESQAKMKYAQPEIDMIREEMEMTEDPQEKMALQQEMMAVNKKYGISMLGGLGGCLPLLLQMPILSAIYFAVRVSPEIKASSFMGIHLGERSLILTILVAALFALQGWLSTQNMASTSDNPQAQSTAKSMMIMNPLMMGWIAYASSAGLGIYLLTGAVIAILQQLYMNHYVRPKVAAKVDQEMKKFENVPKRQPKKIKKVAPQAQTADRLIPTKQQTSTTKKNRNAGKQQRK